MLPGERLNAIIALLNDPQNNLDRKEICSFLYEAIENEGVTLDLSYKVIPFDEYTKRQNRISQANKLLALIKSTG